MLKALSVAGVALALTFGPAASAQDTDEASPASSFTYEAVNFDTAVDRDDILVLDLSNGQRVQIRLMDAWAPGHVDRVKTLARQGFYDGVIFHRVIEGFMAQTGDPTGTGQGGSQLPDLKAEFNPMPHLRGTVSMARANEDDSANSQFFITFYPRFSLDKKYTNFGRVISGMGAVDAIKRGEPPVDPTRIVQASIASDNKPVPAPQAFAPAASPVSASTGEQEAPKFDGVSIEELGAPIGE
ncbi:Peptidylprolyl isomerase [Alteripontixanthobacter maritimus]|uniref:Peptidyl-prolyl cis-trans isomerase n=2 Tax=Alteripontixanthobacter maritimus TaxID=2161824 RepID=A0A369Q550_9SPHN|nr:peptidylprolyl isomerase [Alteripontixanthobacter maritimus]RDC59854.1 Peptidylprolyl isomerase [Alteripontixanthobacter maritimus]